MRFWLPQIRLDEVERHVLLGQNQLRTVGERASS